MATRAFAVWERPRHVVRWRRQSTMRVRERQFPYALCCPASSHRPTAVLDAPNLGPYRGGMAVFRTLLLVLAVLHGAFTALTAMVGAFADGGSFWERLLLILIHPLAAAGLLLLVFRPRLSTTMVRAIAALLAVNVLADLTLAQLIAGGSIKGDWQLAVIFAAVPAVGLVYALTVPRLRRQSR